MCFTSDWINNYVADVSKGAFLSLNTLLPKYAPKTYAAVPASFWDAAKINGNIYGIVNQQISARCAALVFPADDATKFGLNLAEIKPGDLSSLTPYLLKVHAAEPNEYTSVDFGDLGEYNAQDQLDGWNIPGAINVSDPTMTVFDQWDSPAMRSTYAVMQTWNKDGLQAVGKRITETLDPMTDRSAHLQMVEVAGTYKPGDEQLEQATNGFPVVETPSNNLLLTTGGITANDCNKQNFQESRQSFAGT
jgi:putative aldouronate transport system substrate-binding protein